MDFERVPHLPPKAKLSWHISRLSLSPDGSTWIATAWKGNRVAIIRLPPLTDASSEDAWLHSEGIGEIRHATQREVDFTALDSLSVGQVEACHFGQVFLRPAAFEAQPLHVSAQLQHQFQCTRRRRGCHGFDHRALTRRAAD